MFHRGALNCDRALTSLPLVSVCVARRCFVVVPASPTECTSPLDFDFLRATFIWIHANANAWKKRREKCSWHSGSTRLGCNEKDKALITNGSWHAAALPCWPRKWQIISFLRVRVNCVCREAAVLPKRRYGFVIFTWAGKPCELTWENEKKYQCVPNPELEFAAERNTFADWCWSSTGGSAHQCLIG